MNHGAPLLAESLLLLSYSHLLLSPKLARFLPSGEGVLGPILDSLNEELRAKGDSDPMLCLRPLSLPPLGTALCNNGLDTGENGVPVETRRSEKLAPADNGEALCLLAGLALRDVDSLYLGGVTKVVPGVAGGVAVGSRPSRVRCVGVSGISERSSLGRNNGYKATRILKTKKS